MERIQKILAQAGIASRRKCEELISSGKVTVNGTNAKLGDKAGFKDKILVEGKPIKLEKQIYIKLNKPIGYVTTVTELHGMKTIMDLVKTPYRLFPVGRLDKNTEGLIFLTNDGEFANKIIHPSYSISKEYEAVLDKPISAPAVEHIKNGIKVDGEIVEVHSILANGKTVVIKIHEGRKHIVRKLFSEIRYNVIKLKRTRIGPVTLEGLKKGEWKELSEEERKKLVK